MTSLFRSFAAALVLLAIFLAAAAGLQWWVHRESTRLREETLASRWMQLEAALLLAPRAPESWDAEFRRDLGRVIEGRLDLYRGAEPRTIDGASMGSTLSFDRPHPHAPGWRIRGTTTSPALERMQLMQTRSLVSIVLLAGLLALIPILVGVLSARRQAEGSRAPWQRAESVGLQQFARMSFERGAELEREQDARLRAEEDLQVSRGLLDRSLDERIRLGRELHDNISQTLYAVGLTLESVRKNMTTTDAMAQRFDQCMAELRRLNSEVRAHIRELEPEQVRTDSLAGAVESMLVKLPTPDGARIEHRLDDEAMSLVPHQHAAEVVNIIREAVSNSLRHGAAKRVQVRAERGESSVALAVIDAGNGFDLASRRAGGGGHGLANMEARAASIGASIQINSAPGKGTRVLLNVPIFPSS